MPTLGLRPTMIVQNVPCTIQPFYVLLLCSLLSSLTGGANVTTIFRLKSTGDDFSTFGLWSVLLSGSARGLPLRRGSGDISSETEGISNVWAGQPCCDSWKHEDWVKLDQQDPFALDAPLNKEPIKSATLTRLEEKETDPEFVKVGASKWKGHVPLTTRVRLAFTPTASGVGGLFIFFCEDNWDDHGFLISLIAGYPKDQVFCKGISVSGCSENGKRVRFEVTSSKLSVDDNAFTKTIKEDTSVPERWGIPDKTYHFQLERTTEGDLAVRLEGGDPDQRDSMIVPGDFSISSIGAHAYTDDDSDGRFIISKDPAWRGQLLPGEAVKIIYKPPTNGTGSLGFALCEDRFQDKCVAKVIIGSDKGSVIFDENDPPYWIAGFQEANKNMSESLNSSKWNPVQQYEFTLHRRHNGTVVIRRKGSEWNLSWGAPPSHHHFVVDSYKGRGSFSVEAATRSISAPVWQLTHSIGELRSPWISKTFVSGDTVCVSLVARVGEFSKLSASIQRFKSSSRKDVGQIQGSKDAQWSIERFVILPGFLKNHDVQIVVTAEQPPNTSNPVLVQWAAGCNPDKKEDEVILGYQQASSTQKTEAFDLDRALDPVFIPPINNSVCANDGSLNVLTGDCLCRPGFTGRLCERGCGPNRFGEDCQSRCMSSDFDTRQCRGMWLCNPNLPCDCAPGLTGSHCEKTCEGRRWGVGCRQECGLCAGDEPCDIYTGACKKGCRAAVQPPLCARDAECGRTVYYKALIGRGTETDSLHYPWHVAVFDMYYSSNTSRPDQEINPENICGGTLLSSTVVISAAHCFQDRSPTVKFGIHPPEKYKVAFGKTFRNWDAEETPSDRVQKRSVIVIHIPPEYRGQELAFQHDIALLEVDEPVQFNDYVVPICFDYVGDVEYPLIKGSDGFVVGWGLTESQKNSDILKEAKLPFVPRADCLETVKKEFRPYAGVGDKFCAGRKNDSFVNHGDSGGGLVFSQRDVWFIRGIVSVGSESDLSLTAYTNVSSHRNWIKTIKQKADIRLAANKYWQS